MKKGLAVIKPRRQGNQLQTNNTILTRIIRQAAKKLVPRLYSLGKKICFC